MKVVSIYKCWSGQEWLEASIESILPFVDKVVLLTSDVSWIGGKKNPSLKVISGINNRKVVHWSHNEQDQLKHVQWGYDRVKEKFNPDWVQFIDSDEVWDAENYTRALEWLRTKTEIDVFRSRIYTYIKSPFFRVDPVEPLEPVCFIRPTIKDLGDQARACTLRPNYTMKEVYYHHFVFVRETFNKVLEKLIQSHVSENQLYEPMDEWIPKVWNQLPDYDRERFNHGFHMAIGFQHNWQNIKKISERDLPAILREPKFRRLLSFGA